MGLDESPPGSGLDGFPGGGGGGGVGSLQVKAFSTFGLGLKGRAIQVDFIF